MESECAMGAFVTNRLYYHGISAGDTAYTVTSVIIIDTLFLGNMIRVDPAVDAQLIEAAQNPEYCNFRTHYQTYSMYQMSLLTGQSTFEDVIPIKISFLKAIYFSFAP